MQENTAQTVTEWVFVAKSVAQMPYGQNPALRCMAHAETQAQDVTDWLAVATAWQRDFSNSDKARECMNNAESLAQNSADWILITDSWAKNFDGSDFIRCFFMAEEIATNVQDLMLSVKLQVNNYPEIDNITECLDKAARMAENAHDWNLIAATCDGIGLHSVANAARRGISIYQWLYDFNGRLW